MKRIRRKDFIRLMDEYKLSLSNIEVMKPIDIYHVHNWDHTIMHWNEDHMRRENPPIREFYFDLKDMFVFIRNYLDNLSFQEAIVASLYGGRFVGIPYDEYYKQCVEELKNWLHAQGLRINSSDGLSLTKAELLDCIDMISESGFMGMSGLHVIIPESGIVIKVHHHMNYLIYTKDFEKQKIILRELTNLNQNVIMFTKHSI